MRKEQEINLLELTEGAPNEEKCRAYLEGLRWPAGLRCPRCDSDEISRIKTRDQLDCNLCRYRFSVTAGTIFHDTHLPLWKLFVAVNLIVESEGDISASRIKRTIGISYKTAWHLRYRIRDALAEANAHLLESMIEAAGIFLGSETEGKEHGHWDGDAAVGNAADAEEHRISEWHAEQETRNRGTEGKTGKHRHMGRDADGKAEMDFADATRSLSNRGIGSFHPVSDEHLDALLNVLTPYFDRQENPHTFRDAMCKLLIARHYPYKKSMDKRKG